MVFPAQHSGQSLRLPSPPTLLSRLLTMLAEDRSSAIELAEVILEDPGLTARVLRVANSSFYSFSNKIETVSHAIALLGCQAIRILCASESFLAIFPRRKGSFSLLFKEYCRHSLVTALLAKILAEELAVGIESEKVFIAGLLHDIGKPVLWYNFLEKAPVYHELRDRGLSEREAERLAYGVDHNEAGAWVAGEWGLDSDFAKVMAAHHERRHGPAGAAAAPPAACTLVDLIALADTLAKCLEVKAGKLVLDDTLGKIIFSRHSGLDWQRAASAFIEQAPLYGLDHYLGELRGAQNEAFRPVAKAGKRAEADAADKDYEALVKRSLALFKAYSSFLDNFKLTDVFAGIVENLSNIAGVTDVYIMLYNAREQTLSVRSAVGLGAAARLGQGLLLDGGELETLPAQNESWTFFASQPETLPENSLSRKLAAMFLSSSPPEQGLFLPVYSERRLLGAFCLCLENGFEADAGFKELLFGHAVQLALAVRFYRLTQKLLALGGNEASATSALVLGHALKAPLAQLHENIYMLDQDGRNAGFSRTGYRHIYCQKIKRALEDVNAIIARYTKSSAETRAFS
ncbi:MAG: HDOD domain-containing protein [Deltaproteobacteria bacterium]|nr:HDOD domain-containing protein [Deltaproteobacteria bacterium]